MHAGLTGFYHYKHKVPFQLQCTKSCGLCKILFFIAQATLISQNPTYACAMGLADNSPLLEQSHINTNNNTEKVQITTNKAILKVIQTFTYFTFLSTNINSWWRNITDAWWDSRCFRLWLVNWRVLFAHLSNGTWPCVRPNFRLQRQRVLHCRCCHHRLVLVFCLLLLLSFFCFPLLGKFCFLLSFLETPSETNEFNNFQDININCRKLWQQQIQKTHEASSDTSYADLYCSFVLITAQVRYIITRR